MPDVSYRTGQAAKALGLSSYQVRRLAECGLIAAEYTGTQWRVAAGEIDRLLKEGVPEIPANNDESHRQPAPPPTAKPTNGLLAPPSAVVVSAAEAVAITENLLKRRRLELELRGVEDRLSERERVEAGRRAEEEREERTRLAGERAGQQREQWLRGWEEHGLSLFPSDASSDLQLAAHKAIRNQLVGLQPIPTDHATRTLVNAIIDPLLARWRRRQQIQKAIEEARDTLPYQLKGFSWSPTEWDIRAREAAAKALEDLRPGASYEEMCAVAKRAVQLLIDEYQAQQAAAVDAEMRQRVIRGTRVPSWITPEGQEIVQKLIEQKFAVLPVGTPQARLEQQVKQVLADLEEAVREREAQAKAKEQHRGDAVTAVPKATPQTATGGGLEPTHHRAPLVKRPLPQRAAGPEPYPHRPPVITPPSYRQ